MDTKETFEELIKRESDYDDSDIEIMNEYEHLKHKYLKDDDTLTPTSASFLAWSALLKQEG